MLYCLVPPNSRLILTPRDTELLTVLTHKARVLSLEQIARTWWPAANPANTAATRRLQKLEDAGLIHLFTMLARPEIALERPLAVWMPGKGTPALNRIARVLQSRWTLPPRTTPAVIASAHAATRFGGYAGRFPRTTEQTHDLHVAALYLNFRTTAPDRAEGWISEDNFRSLRKDNINQKLPDAVITNLQPHRAIELGGQYTAGKLSEFHSYCANLGMPYEIW